jgi:prepilin-type processing-associated H-X9-DG protein
MPRSKNDVWRNPPGGYNDVAPTSAFVLKPYRISSIRRAAEVVILFESVQLAWNQGGTGWPIHGDAEWDLYNLHSSRMYWQGMVYDPNDGGNNQPVVTYGINRDAAHGGDSARGHIRWRHSRNQVANFLFADGHVEGLTIGRGHGGQLLGKNVMVNAQ